ncbi:hypothetical protein CEB3_c44640 [Peptococcaceae bacterium CEB3]|nr:hypothetical protein CEB3_c44640 [Peptococcaceae bacterium CEB3]
MGPGLPNRTGDAKMGPELLNKTRIAKKMLGRQFLRGTPAQMALWTVKFRKER